MNSLIYLVIPLVFFCWVDRDRGLEPERGRNLCRGGGHPGVYAHFLGVVLAGEVTYRTLWLSNGQFMAERSRDP